MIRAGFSALAALGALALAGPLSAQPVPAAGYGDGMVLQADAPVVIGGMAAPGARVTGTLGKQTARATTGTDGHFTLTFPQRSASDVPVALTLADETGSVTLNGLLVGDVYLCSGQSNMELPVSRALDTYNQTRLAADDGIRLLMIPKSTASLPRDTFAEPVRWTAATGESVQEFSAACFYMAKALRQRSPDRPVGLIHSNWGGSAARAWLAPSGVRALYGQTSLDQLALYDRDPLAATLAFLPAWFEWYAREAPGSEPWKDSDTLEWQDVPQISFWNDWAGTGLDTDAVANVWLRKRFDLTAEQARSGVLNIGAIDDLDLTFVNGKPVGYTFGWGLERAYRVPEGYLKEGRNEILIAANNMWDTGGFFAGPDRLFYTPADGSAAVPLGDGWEFHVTEIEGVPPRAPWDANAGIGVMHNAMIAPLGPMRLAGVAWYQGESDVGQADYDAKLRELFAGWRNQFGDRARMLVVQLADFGQRRAEPAPSGWAQLRQDQLDGVVADENAALVTAIDIGEPTDIHPANKNDLGKRLAAAAVREPMPMPARARRVDGEVIVSFDGVEGELYAMGGAAPLGVELCDMGRQDCRWAQARTQGSTLVVQVADGAPSDVVRHAWADAPIVNTFDARVLPLPGFEIEVMP